MNVDEAVENVVENQAPKIFCEAVRQRVTEEECVDLSALKEDVKTGAAALNVPNPMTRGRAAEVTLIVDRRPLPEIKRAEHADAGDEAMNAVESVENASEAAETNTTMNAVQPPPAEPPPAEAPPPETSAEEPAAATPNQVSAELPGEDHPFYSRVGRYMKATLVGQGFEIKLIEPSEPVQEIPPGGQGTWIWQVTPRAEGARTLTALTEAVGKVEGRDILLGNGRASKTITVEVRTIDRVWDMLVAAPAWLKALAALLTAFGVLVGAWLGIRNQWRKRNA